MTNTDTRVTYKADLVFGGVWLLFLFSPIQALLVSEAPAAWRILAAGAIALFAVGYLISYPFPAPGRLGEFGGAGVWTAALGALTLLTIPAIGAYALTLLPFLVAVSVFRLPAPWDVVGALVPVTVAIVLLMAFVESQNLPWLLATAVAPLALMVPISRTIESLKNRSMLSHDLALSRQREQVGRDVHDILGHSLTVIAVKTELASKLLDRDPARARAELDDILTLARSSLSEVRATVTQLQSPRLASQLTAAETALKAAGIRAECPARVPDLGDASSELLAWCLREAVTNVVRHSGATRCAITVSDTTLTVTDDGMGRGGVEGNGLRGMRERVADAGGTMVLRDARGEPGRPGTRLEVTL